MECDIGVLLDTNIVLYLDIGDESKNKESLRLKEKSLNAVLALPDNVKIHHNLTIFKEISVGVDSRNIVEDMLETIHSTLKIENEEIMFLGAQRYRDYIKDFNILKNDVDSLAKKSKTIPNDYVIGATAEYYSLTLMTNDGKDFKKYFPDVRIIEI